MSYYAEEIPKDVFAHCTCLSSPLKRDIAKAQSCATGIIDDIMKKYFCQKAGQGSSCSLFSDPKGSQYSMDRRLLYWTQILEDRKRIACRIQKATGKRLSHVLYNQLEEHRNVQNVKRIMDYAQRLNPTKLSTRQRIHIQDPELYETLPRSERQQLAENLEIVGTPKVSQVEQCIRQCDTGNNSYLTSQFLRRKIEVKKRDLDMDNVLEFYPEIDRLQVVGHRIRKHSHPAAERISDFELSMMSSDSNLGSFETAEFPEYSIQINDTILRNDMKYKRSLTFHLKFKCKPFERQTQALCKLKNIGRKPVVLVWRRIKPRGAAYVQPNPPAFVFNRNAFRLTFSETEDIEVLFMSSQRMISEEQWYLKTEPDFFEDTFKILVNLSGECYIPEDYYSNMVCDLLDSLLCGILPGGEGCGTRRKIVLSEKELFENNNPGFKCEPGDLRRFKEIYRQVKRKVHPPAWDMNLQTLKQIIEGVEDYTQRSMYLEAFMKIIREMKRRIPDCDTNIKVLLARSLIVSILDQWEVKAAQIVDSIARTNVDVLLIKMPFEHVIEQIKHAETDIEKRKIFQSNALYIQMYCSFCDLAEDIVSFMENCLLLYAY